MRGFGNCWKSALKRGIYPDFSAPRLQEGFKLGGKGIEARDWGKKEVWGWKFPSGAAWKSGV